METILYNNKDKYMTWIKMPHTREEFSIYFIDLGNTIFNYVYTRGMGVEKTVFISEMPKFKSATEKPIDTFPNKKTLIKALFFNP